MEERGVPLPKLVAERALETCFLPPLRWEDALRLQQRLVYELGEAPRRRAALLLVEHPPAYTVGRQGQAEDLLGDEPLVPRHWTNRGGGAWRHGPGQLAIYPIVPIDPAPGALAAYRDAVYGALHDVLGEFNVAGERDALHGGVVVADRQIAAVGIAVKNWVAYHGCILNVSVPEDQFALVRSVPGLPERGQTSLLRERVLPIRPPALREAVARRFAERLGFTGYLLCPPPLPLRPPPRKALRNAAHR